MRLNEIQFLWGFLGITRSPLNEPWFPTSLFGATHLIATSNQAYCSYHPPFLSFWRTNLPHKNYWILLVISVFNHQPSKHCIHCKSKEACPSITLTINLFLPDCATSTPLESRLPNHLSQRLSHKLSFVLYFSAQTVFSK